MPMPGCYALIRGHAHAALMAAARDITENGDGLPSLKAGRVAV